MSNKTSKKHFRFGSTLDQSATRTDQIRQGTAVTSNESDCNNMTVCYNNSDITKDNMRK